MKKIFLTLTIIASLSLTTSAFAQKNKKGLDSINKELNLTADQQQKIETERSAYKVKVDELKAKKDLSKDEKRAQANELRQQHMATVNNILTPEQQVKAKELRSHKGVGLQAGRKGSKDAKHLAGDRTERMKDLNLTDDQKQKIKEMNKDFREKSQALAKEHRDELNKIYTPDQQAKLKELRGDFYHKHRPFHGHRKDLMANLDEASKEKLKTLREDFDKQKKAVELSRIAPQMQKQRIDELRQNFRKERAEIIKNARTQATDKPA